MHVLKNKYSGLLHVSPYYLKERELAIRPPTLPHTLLSSVLSNSIIKLLKIKLKLNYCFSGIQREKVCAYFCGTHCENHKVCT